MHVDECYLEGTVVPCGTFNIVNTGVGVRDVAPPQMCQSQSHHVTLGMTIGRSPR